MRVSMNVDAGETESEPEALWTIPHALNIACGGHAGDARSMERVLRACSERGVRAGAHPSYPDREGFGRRTVSLATEALEASIAAQCRALRVVAERVGIALAHAKMHGALYHDAARDPAIAEACVHAVRAELGGVALVGPAGSELERAARAVGSPFLREGFADRGRNPDGSLVPRGKPGALVEDPARAAAQARELAESGTVDTICVHGDTPGALAIARAVREALDALG